MATRIRLTEDDIQARLSSLEKTLRNTKSSTGKVSYTVDLDSVNERATLRFTERAYLKMISLVEKADKEIGWHGVATRGEGKGNEYIISDIVVYPQIVGGADVTPDQVEYQNWLRQLPDDIFNNLRFQGHSHVNMGVTPSETDWKLYRELLAQIDETMFYVFVIWNKRGERTIIIYDNLKNIRFETKDVDVVIGSKDEEILSWTTDEMKEKVSTYKPVSVTPVKTQIKTASYSKSNYGYGGGYYGAARPVEGYDYYDDDDYDPGFVRGTRVKGNPRTSY